MLEEEIVKTDDFKTLEKEMKQESLSKAMLFQSKDGLYMQEFVKLVAMMIFDGKIDFESENAKKVFALSHPDLKIFPKKDKLLVADSEEIVEESYIKPIFADKKIFIINEVDSSMEAAQNKLLKVIEEPPRNVFFLLTCKNLAAVLPTIRSRCNKLELKNLPIEGLRNLLSASGQTAEIALELSDGQIGKALELAKFKDLEGLANDAASVFCEMKGSGQVLEFSKRLSAYAGKEKLILETFNLIIEDFLKIKGGKSQLVRLQTFRQTLLKAAEGYTTRALCEIASLINKVANEQASNVNMTIAMENLLLGILEVKFLCK